MSLGVCGRIKEKCVIYEHVHRDDSIIIFFINEKTAPYNIWDSTIMKGEFTYRQLISFDIEKEKVSVDTYKDIINFFVHLKKETDSDILVTSDVHNDICLLTGREIIWFQELSFDYRRFIK